jgi:hypothetical protein
MLQYAKMVNPYNIPFSDDIGVVAFAILATVMYFVYTPVTRRLGA